MTEQNAHTADIGNYPTVITSLRSPLSLFGLAMLICNAVFSLSAGLMGNLEAFIYAIHTFLGIVFAFVMIAIWNPRALYHPSELKEFGSDIPETRYSRPIVTGVMLCVMFTYAGYQMVKLHLETEQTAYAETHEKAVCAKPSESRTQTDTATDRTQIP